MGFAEIQAAFAANGASAPVMQAQQPPPGSTAPAFAPSPFTVTPAFNPAAPIVQPAPTQQAFQFVPPANAATPPNGGPWAPINPPGERVALGAPAFVQVAADVVANFTQPADLASLGPQPPNPELSKTAVQAVMQGVAEHAPVAEPTKRKRRTKAELEAAKVTASATAPEGTTVITYDPASFAALADEIAKLPPDGSTVEDIVQELFARGVNSVHLTFTKDGK